MTRLFRLISGICLAAAAFAVVPTDIRTSLTALGRTAAAAGTSAAPQLPASLQERRRAARERKIFQTGIRCRTIARELSALKDKPCATGDRLDAAHNVCYPPRNIWNPYVRWDPAAGRCKPRDTYDGAVCVGAKQRYAPGRRHAQSLRQSAGMYGRATAQLKEQLSGCRETATKQKFIDAAERSRHARQCRQARKLNRADLVQLYCR